MGDRKPLIVSKAQLAELFQISTQAIDNWVRHGCPRISAGARGTEAKFDLAAVLPWYRAYKDGMDHRKALDLARTALTERQEQKTALEVERLRATLMPTAELGRILESFIILVRSKLQQLPRKAAPIVMPPDRVRDGEAALEKEVNEILDDLASDRSAEKVLSDAAKHQPGRSHRAADALGEVEETAEADSQPVG